MAAVRLNPLFNALSPGSTFRQYRLLEQIGVGGQGVVWSAIDRVQKQIHAIKFNDVSESDSAEAENARDDYQLEKLIKLQHAHILPVLEYGFEAQMRFTITPYLPGGTLTQKIRLSPLSINEVVQYATEIAAALDYLHSQGIIHRDLKSENILLDLRQNCYLADFGLARSITTSTLAFHTGHGTPPYAPPEQIQSRAITPKSDVFSFGILLYEMFVGQLPWNGKKQLGMEQLSANQELPDPREFKDYLPPLLTGVLRRVTAADPELRPTSTGEIMKAIQRIFNMPLESVSISDSQNGWVVRSADVAELLKRSYAQWKSTDETYNLGLTKFALVNLDHDTLDMEPYQRFMLSQALTYGYNDDQWWQAIRNPSERLAISSRLFKKHNDAITGRVVAHLTNDTHIRELPAGLPENMTATLLGIGVKSENAFLRREVFDGLRTLTRPKNDWGDRSTLDPEQTKQLGVFALEDSEFGDTAAELIGHLHSAPAVRVLLRQQNEERKISALLLIQHAAGNLPAFVPGNLRFRLSMEWIVQRLIQEPVKLVSAYMLAFLGATLGIGMQVYLTYILPSFMDRTRVLTSLEQGLIIGAIFGLGIFFVRLIMERFQAAAVMPRLLAGTLFGGLVMNIALLAFHVLFLETSPRGFLITGACMFMALVFTISGLFGSRLVRMMLSSLAVFVAIAGTWWIHAHYAASLLDLTPVFRYDYAWSMTQVSLTALGVALFIGILGNMLNLSIADG